jgi:uncharacterized phage-like protein YoqJ
LADTLAFTGHRPDKIERSLIEVRCGLVHYLTLFRPDEAITGMADGFDTEAALTCLELDIPLVAAVPFRSHHSYVNNEVYMFILTQCRRVVYVHEGHETHYPWLFQKRNVWMVDNSTRLATCWDGSSGGTANCVRYAKKVGRKMDRVWGIDPNEDH